jgi:hypothetical protein
MAGGVTPAGVRAGRPETLRALVALRGPAVLGFCHELCTPAAARLAAAEAFARFRAAVADADDLAALDPDRLLLSATRHAAAALADAPGCEGVAPLLAAEAGGLLDPAGRELLDERLAASADCRELAARFAAAEAAYAQPPVGTVGPDDEAHLLEALAAAAPVLDEPEPEPEAEAEPEPVPGPEPVLEPDPVPWPDPAPVPVGEPDDAPWADPDPDEVEAEDPYEPVTTAFEPLPEPVPAQLADADPDPAPSLAAAPARRRRTAPRTPTRRRPGLDPRALLPVAVVLAALLVILALAGVFGGDDGAPPRATDSSPAQLVEEPVTTPLPIEVVAVPEPPTGPSGAAGPTGP